MTVGAAEGVVFDLDGTLYHLSRIRPRLALRLVRSLGILRHFGGARATVREVEHADGEALARQFAAELGRRSRVTPERALTWYREEFLGALVELIERRAQPRAGLLPLLGRLRAAGVRLGVATDVGRALDRLRAVGVPPEAFDDVVETEALGALKPSPRALLALADRWGLAPGRIAVVGDRRDRDGAAAAAAGMPWIEVDDTLWPPQRSGLRASRTGPRAVAADRIAQLTGLVSVHAPEHPLAEVAAISERARSDEPQRTSVREDSERGRKPGRAARSAGVLAAKDCPERAPGLE